MARYTVSNLNTAFDERITINDRCRQPYDDVVFVCHNVEDADLLVKILNKLDEKEPQRSIAYHLSKILDETHKIINHKHILRDD